MRVLTGSWHYLWHIITFLQKLFLHWISFPYHLIFFLLVSIKLKHQSDYHALHFLSTSSFILLLFLPRYSLHFICTSAFPFNLHFPALFYSALSCTLSEKLQCVWNTLKCSETDLFSISAFRHALKKPILAGFSMFQTHYNFSNALCATNLSRMVWQSALTEW